MVNIQRTKSSVANIKTFFEFTLLYQSHTCTKMQEKDIHIGTMTCNQQQSEKSPILDKNLPKDVTETFAVNYYTKTMQ